MISPIITSPSNLTVSLAASAASISSLEMVTMMMMVKVFIMVIRKPDDSTNNHENSITVQLFSLSACRLWLLLLLLHPFQLILVKFALWCGLSGWWLSPRDCYNFSPTLLILRKLLSNYMCFSLVLCCRQSLNETETDLDVFFESRCVREYLNVFWEATQKTMYFLSKFGKNYNLVIDLLSYTHN